MISSKPTMKTSDEISEKRVEREKVFIVSWNSISKLASLQFTLLLLAFELETLGVP